MSPFSVRPARLALLAAATVVAGILGGPAAGGGAGRVALSPARAGRADLRACAAAFDSELVRQLRAAGFDIVPAESVGVLRRAAVAAAGGLFDPMSGQPIPGRAKTVEAGMRAALHRDRGVDAWAQPVLETWAARFRGGRVRFDGVEEPSGGRGGVGGLVLGTHEGTLPVLSLVVWWSFAGGDSATVGRGGVRPMAVVEGSRMVPVPAESVLADHARIERAVRLALDSLPGARPAR